MRLVTLEFEGIGSFADTMVIDFEALGTAGLFLVEGPTGSGKSTILDAIVFALYGSTAGSNSDLGRLDSHVRSRSRAPYVQLVFEVNGARYLIRRSPRHQRDKRRGSGTTDDNGSVSLVQLAPQTCDISHKAREVGDWVIEHIGLTKSQFAATIVLAQGEFASFLDANTEARAQILEKVFGTEFYKDVEDQLASMRRAALTRRQRAEAAVQETMHRCLGALGISPGQDDAQRIDAEVLALQEALSRAEERSASADRAYAVALDALRAGEALSQAQTRKRALLTRQAQLADRSREVDDQRHAIADHERAVPIVPAKTEWDSASQRAEEAHSQAARAFVRLSAVGLTSADESDVQARSRTIGTLENALHAERELSALEIAAQRTRRQAVEAELAQSLLEAQQAQAQAGLASARNTLAALVEPEEELSALVLEQARAQADADKWIAVDLAQSELCDAALRQERARADHEQVLARLAAATRQRDQDLASALAAQLRDGQPCLVCGSSEHPDPAHASAGPTQTQLEALQREADTARARLHACDEVVAGIQGGLKTLRDTVPQDRAALQEGLDSLQAQIIQQRAVEAALAAGRREVEALRDQFDAVTEQLGQARIVAQAAKAAAAHADSALAAARELVLASRGEYECVADRLAALQAQVDAISDVLACTAAKERALEEAAVAERVLQETLGTVGFADIDAACGALLPAEQIQGHRVAVADHERQRAELDTELAEVNGVDLDVVVDLAVLREHLGAQSALRSAAHEAKGSIEYRLVEATPLREQLANCLRELEEVRASTDAVIRMAEIATAARSEVLHRVKLSSFVLMRRFQSVVDAANDRLDAISEGRYQLVVETRGLDNRGLAGLDLLVADQRTEQTRSTKSLSGGERFYVALALALGLADVVRSESGGVQLGTLFIDEGFGSLDADTLEEVIDMLEQVRAGQDRVIGLVSHVDLLKQRIDPRISVRRDPLRAAVSTLEVHA